MADVTTTQDFQERMFARIRENMGDLLTDADLKRLVEAAVQKAFFDPTEVRDNWSRVLRTEAPFLKMVREATEKAVAERVTAACAQWVAEHPEAFSQAVDAALAKGMFQLAVQHFENTMRVPMQMMSSQIQTMLAQPR